MTFLQPSALLLLLLLVPIIYWYVKHLRRREASWLFPSFASIAQVKPTLRERLAHLPFILRCLVLTLVIFCIARPQTPFALQKSEEEGIDIMLAMDISVSMLTPDMAGKRIDTAKEVAIEFINNRPHDQIGLTLFGGEAFTQCPLTTDHATLLSMFQQATPMLQQQGILQEGTAIGMGIASAVSNLEQSKSKSKVVILLTDGENNAGEISPLAAGSMAKEMGVRVYIIKVGDTASSAQELPNDSTHTPAETTDLQTIANETGGLYNKAESKEKLRAIYQSIDTLEKSKIEQLNSDKRYEAYPYFALAAFLLFLLELLLRYTWLRRTP